MSNEQTLAEGCEQSCKETTVLERLRPRGARAQRSCFPLDSPGLVLEAPWSTELPCAELLTQSCPTLCNLIGCKPTRPFCPWDSPVKNTGVGCHALLQGIFPTQGSNPGLPHGRQILYQLSYQGSPQNLPASGKLG